MALIQPDGAPGQRRMALEAMRIMDTPPEPRFDRLTRLARRVLDVPYAGVSLLDDHRQWFKSCQGNVDVNVPVGDSFCVHALDQHGITEIPDACEDPRFSDNPLVTGEPWLRFYAGYPVNAPDGTAIGTLCVLDTRPRQLDGAQREDLADLGRLVQNELTLSQVDETVQEKDAEVREFEARKREAESANRAKSRFLAGMSHEIRTPMNGLLGMLQLLETSRLDADQRHYLQVARGSADLLLSLVDDVLDLARIEAGKIRVRDEVFSLESVLDQIEELLRPMAVSKGLTLSLEQAPAVPRLLRGDQQRIQQILLNLLSNAIKYTPSGYVTLSVGGNGSEGGLFDLRVRIADTGPGIPIADQERVFEPFTQLDNAGSDAPAASGTGLGLAITRRLAEMLGGGIDLESEAGRGATFTVNIPLKTAETSDLPVGDGDTEQDGDPVSCQVILLAEDDPVSQLVARSLLERDGHRVTVVDDGRRALQALETERFDLALVDLEMPSMGGPELIRTLRDREASSGGVRTPAVLLTAHLMRGDDQRYADAGLDGAMGKPLRLTELRDVVRRYALNADSPEENGTTKDGGNWALPESALAPDRDALREHLGGDDALVRDVLATLADGLAERRETLKRAMASDERATLIREAHTLKGMFANTQMRAAADLCLAMEQAIRDSADAEVITAYWRRLDDLVAQVLPLLRREIDDVH